jgi:hypothetical protein
MRRYDESCYELTVDCQRSLVQSAQYECRRGCRRSEVECSSISVRRPVRWRSHSCVCEPLEVSTALAVKLLTRDPTNNSGHTEIKTTQRRIGSREHLLAGAINEHARFRRPHECVECLSLRVRMSARGDIQKRAKMRCIASWRWGAQRCGVIERMEMRSTQSGMKMPCW